MLRATATFYPRKPNVRDISAGIDLNADGLRRLAIVSIGWVIAASSAPDCLAAQELSPFEYQQAHMGTKFRIKLYAADMEQAEAAAQAAYRRVAQLNAIFSDYDETSETRKLVRSGGTGKRNSVSEEMWYLLGESHRIAKLTQGAFDPTAGPIFRAWRQARRDGKMPGDRRLQRARAASGFELIDFRQADRTISLAAEHMWLDFGGIAKGYAADEALKVLHEGGITRAMVDAGGDIALGEAPPQAAGWRIALAAVDPTAEVTEFLTLSRCGIATSGDAFQHVVIDGKRYSHLVDPRTGIALTIPMSATVTAPTCREADALASAISVMGPRDGMRLLDKLPSIHGRLIQHDAGETTVSTSNHWPDGEHVSAGSD